MTGFTLPTDDAESILSYLPVGVLLVNTNGVITFANTKAETIFKYRPNEMLGHVIEDLIPHKYHSTHVASRNQYIERPSEIAMSGGRVLAGLDKNGEEFPVQIGLTPLPTGRVLVSLIESENAVIKPSSANDPLTGLPNRAIFNEFSEKLRQLSARSNKSLSVAFVDLDNFKSVNDQYGHEVGDEVICQVANIISNNVRANDVVARVGGDEFVICSFDAGDGDDVKANLERIKNKILNLNKVSGCAIDIGASIGAVTTKVPQGADIGEMVNKADKLMYQSKMKGKNAVTIDESGLDSV